MRAEWTELKAILRLAGLWCFPKYSCDAGNNSDGDPYAYRFGNLRYRQGDDKGTDCTIAAE